jgi:preprotein translocase subunit SecD
MNRYPLWLYLIIALALAVGLLYSIPNLFPESPAVQVAASKATVALDEALLGRVQDALKRANVPYRDGFVDEHGLKLRFEDTDAQIKAMDVIERALGEDYTVALNLISNSPRWLAAIGAKPMYLGLDLRGGVHFLLQVDMQGAITKSLDNSRRASAPRYAAKARRAPAASRATATPSCCGSGKRPPGTTPRP